MVTCLTVLMYIMYNEVVSITEVVVIDLKFGLLGNMGTVCGITCIRG